VLGRGAPRRGLSGGVGRLIDGRRSPVFAMRTAQAGRVEARALLTRRRREYAYDAPKQGLLPMGSCATLFAFLAAIHKRSGRTLLARVELAASAFLLAWFAMYLHTTGVESSRCGLKFSATCRCAATTGTRHGLRPRWCVDDGRQACCSRPRGLHGPVDRGPVQYRPETTERNPELEGVSGRCELETGDILAMRGSQIPCRCEQHGDSRHRRK
jgi:hypothetical protein